MLWCFINAFTLFIVKIYQYLQLKFPDKNITHRFPKDWWIAVQALRLIGHFWKSFWSIKKCLAFLHYLIIINSFQTLGTKVNYLTTSCSTVPSDQQCKWNSCETQHKNNQNAFINLSYHSRYCQKIKNLDPNKAHGHDMISLQMLKLCCESVLPPLELIFKSCLKWYLSLRIEKSKCSSGAQKRW